jgi:hypothetical protein
VIEKLLRDAHVATLASTLLPHNLDLPFAWSDPEIMTVLEARSKSTTTCRQFTTWQGSSIGSARGDDGGRSRGRRQRSTPTCGRDQ